MVDRWSGRVRALGCHCDDGRNDEIHRDDVHDAFRHPRELLEEPFRIGDDDRLRHPETPDPPGSRLGKSGLDDRGPNDGHRQVAADVE